MTNTMTADHVIADMIYVRSDIDALILTHDMPGAMLPLEAHRLPIWNARTAPEHFSIDVQGFTLIDHRSSVVHDQRDMLIAQNAIPRDDMAPVNVDYAQELVPIVQALTGAREVFAQYNTTQVRFSPGAPQKSWMGTSAFAHLDFTAGQVEALIAETLKLTGRAVAPYSRHMVIQSWRVLTDPPQDRPLTLCDSRTVSPDQMIPMEFHGPEGSRHALLQSRVCAWHPQHRWFHYPDMTVDEVLIFKGFDSRAPDAMTAMHSSFFDESAAAAVPRGSVECRFIALFD